jgi:hypothetical protein
MCDRNLTGRKNHGSCCNSCAQNKREIYQCKHVSCLLLIRHHDTMNNDTNDVATNKH